MEASRPATNALRVKEEAVTYPEKMSKPESLTTEEMQGLVKDMQKRLAALEESCLRLAQAEEDSRDRYARLFEFAPIGLVTLDQHNAILEINPYLSNLLRRESRQLLAQDFSLLVADRHKAAFSKFCSKVLRSPRNQTGSLLLQNAQHTETEVQLLGHREVAADGSILLRLSVTATAGGVREQAPKTGKPAAKLKQLQLLLQESQAVAHVGSFRYDLERDELEWSDEFYRLHGLQPGEIKPSLLYLIKHTFVDDQVLIRETLFKAIRSSIPFSLTTRFLRPDGAIRCLHVTGKFFREGNRKLLIGAGLDVTDAWKAAQGVKQKNEELVLANRKLRNEIEGRQRVEEALAASEEKWRTLVEHSPDLIIRFDRSMHQLFANKAAAQQAGILPLKLTPEARQEPSSVTLETGNGYYDHVLEAFRTGRQAQCYTYFNTCSGLRFYSSIAVPEFGPDGEVKTVLSISRDITAASQKE